MIRGQSPTTWTHWLASVVLLLGWGGSTVLFAQQVADDDPVQDGRDTPAEEEKKDPTDIRNAIGNLDLVRGFQRLAQPVRPGTWQTLIDQPYYPPPVRAAKLLFHGQHEQAELAFAALLKESPDNQEYLESHLEAILLQCRDSDVKRFQARCATLKEGQRATARMTHLAARAHVLAGEVDEARKLLKDYVEAHPNPDVNDGQALRVYVEYAMLLERLAQHASAAVVYQQVVSRVEGRLPSDSLAATQVAYALYRGSTLTGEGRDKHRMVMSQLAQVRNDDQTYWPAMLVEAEILVATHGQAEAGRAVRQVLDLNPNEFAARFLAINHAIDQYQFEAARNQINDLKLRSDSATVLAGEGRLLLKERLPEQALAPLQSAVKKDPTLPQARGWLAGAYYLVNDLPRMEEQLAALKPEGLDARHPLALYEAAEILRDARQFISAEKLYLEAQRAASWWAEPVAALAELYLETGQEARAREAYERSYRIDPYNLRAVNQIKLLEKLETFATRPSASLLKPGSDQPAFLIRYDKQDEILAGLALEWMDRIRPEIWSYFQIEELSAPTIIEFFPSHEEFSVRTIGLPWIGTVGASTGHVIAMDVPRGSARNQMGTFDWARVLRHEYTHTVTLAMTHNRVPHWLTEAAACAQEQAPRDWDDCQLLCSNFRAGQLFKIADLNWGFIRPRRSIDRQLAYMQSQWLYEYLVATYGQAKIIEFFHCFRDGMTEAAAWKKTYGKSMEEIDREFLPWAKTQVESWGLPTGPLPKRAEVEAALRANPNDRQALYDLAWLLASGGNATRAADLNRAREHLEKLIALDPSHLDGRELLGGVLNALKQTDKARDILEIVVRDDPRRPVALRTLGLLAMGQSRYDEAEKWFTALQGVRPLENTSYLSLAGIYLSQKQNEKAIGQLHVLQRHEQKDERIPRKLADLYVEAGQLANAAESAFRAIRINPYNAINHQLLAQVLVRQEKPAEAAGYWAHATELQPKIAEFWEGLAEAKGAAGDLEGASAAARKAVEILPNSKAARWIK